MPDDRIVVTTHVARDFLQNSAYFNTLQKVVWEYVSNSLDNAKDESIVSIYVDLLPGNPKKLVIADDGIGMSQEDLARFFQMHGENTQRKKGKRVRGRFGTGKSAAFGIANVLEIDTVKNGLRNHVRLSRDRIESANDGKSFPVDVLVENGLVSDSTSNDGTKVYIYDFMDNRLKFEPVIIYIERHLSRFKQRANVFINGHKCTFNEPASIRCKEFQPETDELVELLGPIKLTVKVSPKPLDTEFIGIDILSYGIWHQATLAGCENKDYANRIFGEVDVEKLEDDNSSIPPFDNTRNNQLNPSNPTVVALLAWIGQKIEQVRLEIVKAEDDRRRSEQFLRLQKSSKEIEEILNDDFMDIIKQYELARRALSSQVKKMATESGGQGEVLPGEGELPSRFGPAGYERGNGQTSRKNPPGEGEAPREHGPNLIPGDHLGTPQEISKNEAQRKLKRGIFSIQWVEGSPDDRRSEYKKDEKTIYINLNHPQVKSAQETSGGALDSKQFKEVTYEIAIVEYALAVQYERAENEELDAFDALFEVGSIIDRVTRKITQTIKQ